MDSREVWSAESNHQNEARELFPNRQRPREAEFPGNSGAGSRELLEGRHMSVAVKHLSEMSEKIFIQQIAHRSLAVWAFAPWAPLVTIPRTSRRCRAIAKRSGHGVPPLQLSATIHETHERTRNIISVVSCVLWIRSSTHTCVCSVRITFSGKRRVFLLSTNTRN